MNDLFIGLLSALLATNQPLALSNLVQQKTGLPVPVRNPADPLQKEYERLLALDDAAQAEVDQWIKEIQAQPSQDSPLEKALFQGRVENRLEEVRLAYQAFLERHPDHVQARLAFGSFLSDIQEEEAARLQWEEARQRDPKNPAAWNNLANYYGHNGPVQKAFAYYQEAINLNPRQSVYYQNLAATMYLFRQQAAEHYQITVPEVLQRAMSLYRKALELDPDNFILASDVAQTYYGMMSFASNPSSAEQQAELDLADQALAAWGYALELARDDVERQGVLLHLARIQINAGRLAQARVHLQSVTNALYHATKGNLLKKLEAKKDKTMAKP